MLRLICIIMFEILNKIDLRYRARFVDIIINKLKIYFLRGCGSKIGCKCRVGADVFILNYKNLKIGDNSSIGKKSEIFNYDLFSIGNEVDIGTELYVNTSDHIFSDNNKALSKQGAINSPVIIENDVWIGARVTILRGAHVQSRIVIGAGTIITGNLFSNNIYAGNPAKIIKKLCD